MLADLVAAIKKAAKQAVDASDPTTWMLGKVTNADPLEISVEQRLTLDADNLILTRNVTDYTTQANYNGGGKHQITIYNGLNAGDLVLLIRQSGGQKFIVVDRVVNS